MNQTNQLQKVNLATVFLRFMLGFGSGVVGTIVLGIVILVSWSIVGEILLPKEYAVANEFGEIITHRESSHPLFLSVIIFAIFLATLIANLFYCIITSIFEEKYTKKSTNLTQVFLGNLVILFCFVPIYIIAGTKYGSEGVVSTTYPHMIITASFTFLVLEILSSYRYLLVSVYGLLIGIILLLFMMNVFGVTKPIILIFLTLPLLLGFIGSGSAMVQMFYHWISENYNNDFLDTEKRFGADYGVERKENPKDFDDI